MDFLITFAASILGADRYIPHTICLTNDPVMVWSYTITNLIIWVAYMVIGASFIARRRSGFRFRPLSLILFGAFVILCGLIHVTEVVTLFSAVYRLDLMMRIATAMVAATTAVEIGVSAAGDSDTDAT